MNDETPSAPADNANAAPPTDAGSTPVRKPLAWPKRGVLGALVNPEPDGPTVRTPGGGVYRRTKTGQILRLVPKMMSKRDRRRLREQLAQLAPGTAVRFVRENGEMKVLQVEASKEKRASDESAV